MSMDEIIRAIEMMDAENMQDILDAVMARHRELYPGDSLVILALPKNQPEQWDKLLKDMVDLQKKCK